MKLSVVIVSYKVCAYLEQCLMSLGKALQGIDAEVIVVDNHSADGTVEHISRRFPSVEVIGSRHNLGFARANNVAIRRSRGQYVLLLNPDTIVAENTVAEVLGFMDAHPSAGSAGVAMLRDNGSAAPESRRGLPTPLTAFYKMSGLCSRFPHSSRFGRYYMGHLPWNRPGRIDVVSGAFCMLRREALDRVGLLDEEFFMYGEDIDLSYRLLKAGYDNWFVPACILHYKGESTHKSAFRYVHVFYNAMLIFFRKHYGGMSLLLSVPIRAAIVCRAAVALATMQTRTLRRMLGFADAGTRQRTVYVFVGHKDTVGECRRLARRSALEAVFVEGDEHSMPDGHACIALPDAQDVCVVYDTGAFGYATILRIFHDNQRKGVRMGTYCRTTKTLITREEVIK